MPEEVAGPAAVAAAWLLTYLLHSTLLIGIVRLLTGVTPLRPGMRDGLWKAALLGGVVTSSVSALVPGPAAGLQLVVGSATMGGVGDGALPTTHFRVSSAAWTWLEGAVVLWLLGAVVGMADIAVRLRRLRRTIRRLKPATLRTEAYLAGILGSGSASRGARTTGTDGRSPAVPRRRGIRADDRIRVRVSDELDGPCVLPGSTIALPRRCETDLTGGELRAVLAHEAAHVARRDLPWSIGLRLVAAALWIQPLNRVALASSREAMELACDDWALSRTGERHGLASSISRVAHWSSGRREPVSGVSMSGRSTDGELSRRVRRILRHEHRRPEPAWIRASVAGALVLPMIWLPTIMPPTAGEAAVILTRREIVVSNAVLDSVSGTILGVEEMRVVRGVLLRMSGVGTDTAPGQGRRVLVRIRRGD